MNALSRCVFECARLMEQLCRGIAYVSTATIFVVLTINVFMRYLKLGSFKLGAEVPEIAFPWLVASCVALAAFHGSHIRMQFLRDRLSVWAQVWMQTAMTVVCVCVYMLAAYIVVDLFHIVKDDRSAILKVSLGWTYAAMMVSFVAIVLAECAALLRAWGWGSENADKVPTTQVV